MKRLYIFLLILAFAAHLRATDTWTTYFAYNNVDQVAAGGGKVYGVSTGSLFSVDAMSEHIRTYSHLDGMHGNNIACIKWLEPIQSLMIMYADGRMDILDGEQFQFIPDLYNKYTTFNKLCYSITVRDSLAYLGMDYGIQTFNIRKREFADTYLIGSEASEIPIHSIAFVGQNIYASTDTFLLTASLNDNIIDYAYWSEVPVPSDKKIQAIAEAGGQLYMLQDHKCYRLQGSEWQAVDDKSYNVLNVIDGKLYPGEHQIISYDGLWTAAGEQGIIRQMETGSQVTYLLDGPLNNNPYRLTYDQGQLFMVAGGRWSSQNETPGCVIRFDGSKWHNITQKEIVNQVGSYCLDMMNVAVDPDNAAHYFVSSYGTGLYEFVDDKCITRWSTDNSILGSASSSKPWYYTRTDGVIYDAQKNVWVMNGGKVTYNIVVFMADGTQVGMNVKNDEGERYIFETVGQILFDKRNPNYAWIIDPRGKEGGAGLALIDTKGTISDTEDDQSLLRNKWIDQDGNSVNRTAIYSMRQDANANIWLATNNGVVIIPASTDYFTSNQCQVLHLTNEEGLALFEEEAINDIVFDRFNRAWIGSKSTGVHVLNPDADAVLAHYVMDNSALTSNSILSFAYDYDRERMYIGSALGLVAYNDPASAVSNDEQSSGDAIDYGETMQWKTHFAYTDIEDIRLSSARVFALSEGSLCSIQKDDETLIYYSKLNGLNGSAIQSIDFDPHTQTLVIAYDDGMIDLLDSQDAIHPVADLYLKQINSKQVQDIAFKDGKAYLAMPFGIVVLNIRKQEISDTYYIGTEGREVSVEAIAILGDSIYAASKNRLYRANLNDNLVDYALWQSEALSGTITGLTTHGDNLFMLMDSLIYCGQQLLSNETKFVAMTEHNNTLLARTKNKHIFEVSATELKELKGISSYAPNCALKEGSSYWLGTAEGIEHVLISDGVTVQKYQPDGPLTNQPYSLTTSGSQLWVVPGGRWTAGYGRQGKVMRYDGKQWNNLTYKDICKRLDYTAVLYDFGHVAVDPADVEHFYVSCYGTGLVEFFANGKASRYNHTNSPLVSLVNSASAARYCRVDAIATDADGNLWLTNVGDIATNIHVLAPHAQNDPQSKWWHCFNLYHNGQRISIKDATSKFLIDNRDQNYKWIACARSEAGLIFFNDNGTPYDNHDDRAIFRNTFVDQDNKSITVSRLNTIAQDHNGDMWLGTSEGILVIDAATNMLQSNACRRLKISRHDGTSLADYLLGTEQINTIFFAGGNRIWIGTDASGAYLVQMVTKEGIYEPEILAHFTTLNSPMPSDCVLSIAVSSETGEVYIGTAKGLVSYRGDATEPEETFSKAYAYPNPVRPDYEGVVTITGLMDNTTVFIADAAGNVVCRTHSNGGTAVWDCKTQSGKRVHSGVYTIYCNTADGKNHTVLKVLIMK